MVGVHLVDEVGVEGRLEGAQPVLLVGTVLDKGRRVLMLARALCTRANAHTHARARAKGGG